MPISTGLRRGARLRRDQPFSPQRRSGREEFLRRAPSADPNRERIAALARLLYASRDAAGDPGKKFRSARAPKTFKAIFLANAQRVKEALRVCEEFLKLLDQDASRRIQRLRFSFYDLEKKTIKRFPALLDP